MATPDLTTYLPDGLTARPARLLDGPDGPAPDPADHAAVLDLVLTTERVVLGEDSDSTGDEITEMFTGALTDLEATALVHDGDELVAFAWVELDRTGRRTWLDLYALPSRPELLPALLDYGREVAARHRTGQTDDPMAEPWLLRSGCFAGDAALESAFEGAGFERVRRFWRMRIDLRAAAVAEPAPLPTGVEIVDAFDEPVRRTAHDILERAFRDHWQHVDRPYDEWVDQAVAEWADPQGWWVLLVDGRPAAVCLLDESRREIDEGYVRSLGVLREFRGQGLATLLLERAFRYYRERGRVAVQLGVDSDSPTGAQHLYEKVGMTAHRVIDAWALPIG